MTNIFQRGWNHEPDIYIYANRYLYDPHFKLKFKQSIETIFSNCIIKHGRCHKYDWQPGLSYVRIYIYICTTNQMLFYMLGLYIILPTILGISWYILLPNQPTIWIIYIYIYRSAFGLWQACRRPRVTSRVQSNIYIYTGSPHIY